MDLITIGTIIIAIGCLIGGILIGTGIASIREAKKINRKDSKSDDHDVRYYVESPIAEDSTGCTCCGSKMIMIRGKYPKQPKRKVCPTCAVEKLENYEYQNSPNYKNAVKGDST